MNNHFFSNLVSLWARCRKSSSRSEYEVVR